MPFATYQYVYYEPLTVGGPETRQNRNPATSSKYVPIPGITVPATNDLATGSSFTPDTPPASYTDSVGNTYNFGFMNVSGCAGAGETSTDINNLPGSSPFAPLVVGTQPINILVLYIAHRTGPGGGGPGIYLDAMDETTGTFLDNFFVNSITPDNSLTHNVNVYGSLAVEPRAETVQASTNPINTPGVVNSTAIFDKWGQLEGPAQTIAGTNLTIGASTPSNITAFAFYKEPASTYITGSYESPDIILFTPFSTTSVGTAVPITGGSTTVIAGVQYGFAAVIHNDSAFEVSTKVTFWTIPEGLATMGILLDTQTVLIPASTSQVVISSVPFVNTGGADSHTCAAVSLYTADSPCGFNPTTSADAVNIPSPLANVSHSCSAWRNTDSIFVFPGEPWHLILGLGEIPLEYEKLSIGIQFTTQHVAANWAQNDKVLEEVRIHKRIYSKVPPYLIPVLRKALPVVNIKPELKLASKGEISKQPEANDYVLHFADKKQTNFTVSGVVPANAKVGDIYLFEITATYPKAGRLPAKKVQFLQSLVVKAK
jgi:hypothetical protein